VDVEPRWQAEPALAGEDLADPWQFIVQPIWEVRRRGAVLDESRLLVAERVELTGLAIEVERRLLGETLQFIDDLAKRHGHGHVCLSTFILSAPNVGRVTSAPSRFQDTARSCASGRYAWSAQPRTGPHGMPLWHRASRARGFRSGDIMSAS
jgi:hypothetical protein